MSRNKLTSPLVIDDLRHNPAWFIGLYFDRFGRQEEGARDLARILNAAGFYLKAGLDTNRWTAARVQKLYDLRDDADVCAELAHAALNPANFAAVRS